MSLGERIVQRNIRRDSVEWQKVRFNETKGVDDKWKVFREAVLACTREVCSMQNVAGG